MVLEDNDLVHLRGGDYEVYNAGGRKKPAGLGAVGGGGPAAAPISRALLTLEMEVSQIMKVRHGRGRGDLSSWGLDQLVLAAHARECSR